MLSYALENTKKVWSSTSNLFYGITPTHFLKISYQYDDNNKIKHPFNKNSKMAGTSWFYELINRNPYLSITELKETSLK